MKKQSKFLMIAVALVVCSCGPKQNHLDTASDQYAAAAFFRTAEDFFKAKSYENALITYEAYLKRFPNGSSIDRALMRMAEIYSIQGNQDAKLETYHRLVTEHPNIDLSVDVLLEIMHTFYQAGNYKEVILTSSRAIEKGGSNAQLCHIHTMLGDTYDTLGLPVDALLFYHIAVQESESTGKQPLIVKLNTAIRKLNNENIRALLNADDEIPKDLLLYQLAFNIYKQEDYKEAETLFLKFIKTFPYHKKTAQAKNLIEEIYQRTVFNRHLIGCLLPLSGPYKKLGKRALRGIELALDQYNSRLDQTKFQIIVKDTCSEPSQAIEALRHLDEKRVALTIGPIVTSEAVALESQKKRIPIITLTQKADIPDIGDYVFRNFLTPETQIDAIVPFVIERLDIKRFAILYPYDYYGDTFMKLFRDKVLNYGAEITGIEYYQPNQTDFAEPISKLVKFDLNGQRSSKLHGNHEKDKFVVKFDALFIPDSLEKAILIAPQLAFHDIDDVLLLGTNLWHSDDLIKEAGEYVQLALMADGFYKGTSRKKIRDFILAFKERYGETPGIVEAFAYDTAIIAVQIAGDSGIRSRQDLKNELKNLHYFDGVTGITSFKQNGDVEKKLYLLQIDGDKFVELNDY